MAKERPRQVQSQRDREKIVQQEERSIASFGQITQRFTEDFTRALTSFKGTIDEFNKAQRKINDENKKTSQEQKKENKKSKGSQKGVTSENQQWAKKTQAGISKFQTTAGKLGYDRLNKFTSDVFGKRAAKNMTKGMARFSGMIGPKGGAGGGFGKGMMGKAAGMMGSAAGGILRAAGPVGAIFSGIKMLYDFWNSGGLAKMMSTIKMIGGDKQMGPKGIADMRASLEGTEEFRKIDATYAIKKPLELKQQLTQDYFNWEKGNASDYLQYEQSLVKDNLDYEIGLRRDALQFQQQQAMETLNAELDKRKAIAASGISFGKEYLSLSERALKAIGSSTKEIIQAVGKFQQVFGLGLKQSFQLNENAAGLAYHFGVGADDVMNMTNLFRLMGKTSAETAQSLIGGITEFAKLNDLAPQAIFAQIKDAGEDIYKFSNGTAENFVKQASLLTKMSVSMSQMMKASDTMVLNYKDSIKAEMSLSAMLGKNVNLSEVRAKLMSGDQSGAASALKSALGGIDVGAMDPFAKQQLMQATGMDISAIMGIQQGKEGNVKGQLTEQEKAGQNFANGALKQDIANAGAKLALEQEQRKKMLQFEQNQRLVMLMLEQQQRLDGIKLEAAYRAKWELQYAKDFEKDQLAADALVESATNIFASGGFKNAMAGALSSYGLSAEAQSGAMSQVEAMSSKLATLQKAGYIQNQEMQPVLMKVFDALQNKKEGEDVGTIMNKAIKEGFGPQMAKYQADVNKQIERQINIANAYMKGGKSFAAYKKQYNVSDEEVAGSKKLLNVGSEYVNSGMGQGARVEKVSGLNQTAIDELRKANDIGIQAKIAEGANKPMLAEVKGNGQKTIAAQNQLALQQQRTLSESEYNTKIQLEQVALAGLSLQMLAKIMENTANGGDITLNGKVITSTLLNQSRRNYGVARTEKIA